MGVHTYTQEGEKKKYLLPLSESLKTASARNDTGIDKQMFQSWA